VALRRYNSGGVGKAIPVKRDPKHVNLRKCKTCGAKRGQTCIRLTATRMIELTHTHSGIEVRRDEFVERLTPGQIDGRRKSTPSLDARYQARQSRNARRKDNVNGGPPMKVTPPDLRPMALDETYDR